MRNKSRVCERTSSRSCCCRITIISLQLVGNIPPPVCAQSRRSWKGLEIRPHSVCHGLWNQIAYLIADFRQTPYSHLKDVLGNSRKSMRCSMPPSLSLPGFLAISYNDSVEELSNRSITIRYRPAEIIHNSQPEEEETVSFSIDRPGKAKQHIRRSFKSVTKQWFSVCIWFGLKMTYFTLWQTLCFNTP